MADSKQIHQISGAIHDSNQFPAIIECITGCKYYAYIFHDKDIDDDGNIKPRHIHFIAEDRHSLRVWSKLLGIPENMIEIPRNFRAVNRYLIHKDDSGKYQYSSDDVITNLPIKFKAYLEDNREVSPKNLYLDLLKVKRHLISKEDFISKYEFFIYKQSFLSQYKILTDIINNYD